jgi:hypothetical protein
VREALPFRSNPRGILGGGTRNAGQSAKESERAVGVDVGTARLATQS